MNMMRSIDLFYDMPETQKQSLLHNIIIFIMKKKRIIMACCLHNLNQNGVNHNEELETIWYEQTLDISHYKRRWVSESKIDNAKHKRETLRMPYKSHVSC